jgi:hypothetical protein
MAKKRFLVVKDSFIGLEYIRAEQNKIVEIETDVAKGGMTPGSNLVEVDDDGTPVAAKAGRASKQPAAKTEQATDLA